MTATILKLAAARRPTCEYGEYGRDDGQPQRPSPHRSPGAEEAASHGETAQCSLGANVLDFTLRSDDEMTSDYTFSFTCPGCKVRQSVPLFSVTQGFSHTCPCGEEITLTDKEQAAVTVLQALVTGLAATDKKISIGGE